MEEKAEISAHNQQTVKPKKVPGRPFVKGQSGNLKGKPKGTLSITSAIKKRLLERYPDASNPKSKKLYLDKLIDGIMINGVDKLESRTQKDIWSYIDGMPKNTIGIEGDKETLDQLTDFFKLVAKKK